MKIQQKETGMGHCSHGAFILERKTNKRKEGSLMPLEAPLFRSQALHSDAMFMITLSTYHYKLIVKVNLKKSQQNKTKLIQKSVLKVMKIELKLETSQN